MAAAPSVDAIRAALAGVEDPEIHRPITELGHGQGHRRRDRRQRRRSAIYLTVAGCPMKETITTRVTTAVSAVSGVTAVRVDLDVMRRRAAHASCARLRGDAGRAGDPVRPARLADPRLRGRVRQGRRRQVVGDGQPGRRAWPTAACRWASSTPTSTATRCRACSASTASPPRSSEMIMPPQAHGVKVISIGMFTPGNTPVVWRGPMLHRALQQFLADVFWGDLDVLLMDLPPGTGDIAISVAQLIPSAEILVVTTPQQAAAEVAERAGAIALQTHQRVVGVVENMSWMEHARRLAHGRLRLRRRPGRGRLADAVARRAGAAARPDPARHPPARGRRRRRPAGAQPSPSRRPARRCATSPSKLTVRSRGLAGMSLNISPAGASGR